jgi:hypothetical protein
MPTVRVGDPGTNLVGQNWSGLAHDGEGSAQQAHAGGRQQ